MRLTLKFLAGVAAAISVSAMAAVVFSALSYMSSVSELEKVHDSRYQSYLLADELRQSSDDLTRLARTYVVTGDDRYETQYLDILAIRGGQKPRPEGYHRVYWDFVAATDQKPRPDGETAALQDLMRQAGFTEQEFGKLSEAQANSDGLVQLEVKAMNAVKGLFANEAGEYVVKGDPDLALARELMHSRAYHAFKADIVTPIDAFYVLLEERTAKAIAKATAAVDQAAAILNAALVVLALTIVAACIGMFAGVLRPLEKLRGAMQRLSDGDTDVEILGAGRQDEVGAMAKTVKVFQENAAKVAVLEEERTEAAEKREAELASDEERRSRFNAELADVVACIGSGDLSRQMDASGKSETMKPLCDQVNQLTGTLNAVIDEFNQQLGALAKGDLTVRSKSTYAGKFAELQGNANQLGERLAETVSQIQLAADDVDSAAAEIASGTDDLAQRTEQAAISLDGTAKATKEVSETVGRNAENARRASELAQDADQSAKSGGDVVQQAVAAMSKIENSAKEITEIITVIDEIAFQTNLLALNASVEAARAGEAGKGFAVVAQEVRQLAQRSAEAATSIKTLIQDSNGQVKEGVSLVNQTGEGLARIVAAITDVTEIVQNISGASEEQAIGVQGINDSVAQLDEMTQQNAAMVEESNAVARSLGEQSKKLTVLLSIFTVETQDGRQGRAA